MPHRAHLFSLRIANAFRESVLQDPYTGKRFGRDVLAGITVGIIAIPLAMALAIASGVAPQYGLYTAIIAGFIIALTGGSHFSVSGPTAAFVVILYPVAQKFGLAGLLLAGLMAGFILIGMALLRLGRLIEYIPESVTLGFTAGIAIVIVTLQLKDFFGLQLDRMPEHWLDKIQMIATTLPELGWPATLVAIITLLTLILWPRLKTPVPGHLPAVMIGVIVSLILAQFDHPVETIGTRFSYLLPGGATGQGIPPFLPGFEWPWLQTGANGQPFVFSLSMIEALLPAAFAIAMLGAIESLLCAVVLDGMTGKRHSANSELLGQGIGNIITPFFGGITATAAIARSAANVKAGAESPIAGMIHALLVLLALVWFAQWLSYLPMASMAALLVMVAWNISEAPKIVHLLKKAPRSDIMVFILCMSLTVLFDMVIAICAGIVLASLLFMKEIAEMTKASDITGHRKHIPKELPPGWRVIKINGPLFFAAADRVFGELSQMAAQQDGVVLYMDGVPILDNGGLAAMRKFLDKCRKSSTRAWIADLQFQPLKTISRAGLPPVPGWYEYFPTLEEALNRVYADTRSD